MFKELFISCRPKQWIKNIFVFTGLLFSFNLFDPVLAMKAFYAFTCFCIASSGVYLLNDILDREEDCQHPEKSLRPIASGRLNINVALATMVIFSGIAVVWGVCLEPTFGIIVASYVILNIAYSKWLKHVVIIDVLAIATFFALRVAGGAIVLHVGISEWTLMCVILLSIFLGLSKRRHELMILETDAKNHRAVLSCYNSNLLDQMIGVATSSTLIAYIFFTVSDYAVEKFGSKKLMFSVPFVIYGIFRYLYLVHKKEEGGSPAETLLMDKPLLLDVVLWAVSVVLIVYLSV
jgi:4-hydroxybenzoate polyprenyltransferase